jgi:hypothetical protein
MKKFKDFDSAFKWVENVVKDTNKEYLPAITEQAYKDSRKYTYIDTSTMYESGAIYSQFDKGLIKLRAPYVKVRYYKGGKAGDKNRSAIPMWFERTKSEEKGKYKAMYKKFLEVAKK